MSGINLKFCNVFKYLMLSPVFPGGNGTPHTVLLEEAVSKVFSDGSLVGFLSI